MRKFWKIQQWFLCLVATLGLCLFCALTKGVYVSKFADIEGKRSFYLNGASSQALTKSKLNARDVFRVKGESVSFITEEKREKEEIAKEFMKKYGATLVVKEDCADVLSYYAYTGDWKEYVLIEGRAVNLHVAIAKEGGRVTIGYPIIFGGF